MKDEDWGFLLGALFFLLLFLCLFAFASGAVK